MKPVPPAKENRPRFANNAMDSLHDDSAAGGLKSQVRLRGRLQPTAEARYFDGSATDSRARDALNAALACVDYSHAEPLIESMDATELTFLDIDWHNAFHAPPDEPQLLTRLMNLPIPPLMYWRTHGGGGRCVYVRIGEFAADDIALLMRFFIERNSSHYFNPSGVEVKNDTRHPHYLRDGKPAGSPVSYIVARAEHVRTAAMKAVGAQGEVDEVDFAADAVNELLTELGLTGATRFNHSRCPINPTDTPSANDGPVVVLDRGIHCHKCSEFLPYAKMLGNRSQESAPLSTAVRCMTHFAHADLMLVHFGGLSHWTEQQRRKLWSVMLRAYHLPPMPADADENATAERAAKAKLVEQALFVLPVIRAHGQWVHLHEPWIPIQANRSPQLIAAMPAISPLN